MAASPATVAPEYRMRAVLRREFDPDSPAIRLVIQGPLEAATEYLDSHQVVLAIDLLQRALSELQEAERRVDVEWLAWRGDAIGELEGER